jgi:response regulator RpfG family c-di-GMP phosphodiesterase
MDTKSQLNKLEYIITFKVKIIIFGISLISLLFLQTYSTHICPYIDGLQTIQIFRNLGIIWLLHIIYRLLLYSKFNNKRKKLSLARQAYFLSIISWVLAGFSAFLLHFFLYPDFPIGSHIKLLSSYLIFGAGIISQIEYLIFEKSFNKVKINNCNGTANYNENISKRFTETFLIFSLAPLITLVLILLRYKYDGLISGKDINEVFFISSMLFISIIILAVKFKNLLKNDTKIILENLQLIKNYDYKNIEHLQRSDELGQISKSINEMGLSIKDRNDTINLLNEEIINTQREVIFTMGAIAETRSKETGNHVKRVAQYSKILAIGLGLSIEEAELLKLASPMHDIGKVGIPDNILNKPGKHTKEEFEIMKTHSQLGYDMLKNSNKEILQAAAIISHHHHERWNGKGYPQGLIKEDIHIYARITAVADVFDALGSDRCYKQAWEDEKIFKLLKGEKGEHFDPKIVDCFFDNLEEIKKVRNKYKD